MGHESSANDHEADNVTFTHFPDDCSFLISQWALTLISSGVYKKMKNPEPLLRALTTDVEIGHKFDAGRSDKENEDNYGLFAIRHNSPDRNLGSLDMQIAVVADGIGGSAGGAEASHMAVRTIEQTLNNSGQIADIRTRLVDAVRSASQAIYREAERDSNLKGMGSTIVLVAIAFDYLYVLHEGDSRAYLLRDGKLHQLTQDHSWVQEAIEAGRLSEAEAATHPSRNVIRRYLGIEADVEVDTKIIDINADNKGRRRLATLERLPLQPGDTILLCSDGLTDVVKDNDLERVLSSTDPQPAADRLVRMANANGGPDNITAVVVRWKASAAPVVPVSTASRWSRYALIAVLPIVTLGAAAILYGPELLGGRGSDGTPGAVTQQPGGGNQPIVTELPTETAAAASTPGPTDTTVPPTETPIPEEPTATDTPVAVALAETATPTPSPEIPTETPTARDTSTPVPTATPVLAEAATRIPTNTPTATRTPTATSTRFVTSTPIIRVTNTPTTPPTATRTPMRITPLPPSGGSATATPPPPPAGNQSVTLVSPNDGDSGGGRVTFSWSANSSPSTGQAFELNFKRPDTAWFGVADVTSNNSLTVDLDGVDNDQNNPLKEGTHQWSIWLVQTSPNYQKIRQISEVRNYTFKRSGGDVQQPAPTEAPTPAPTEAPTEAPTPAPTEAPTPEPTPG